MCVHETNLHVITGTVFRASRTNSCKGYNFLPDVVMSHKIEKKLQNVLNHIPREESRRKSFVTQ